jgi:hypothetical protein
MTGGGGSVCVGRVCVWRAQASADRGRLQVGLGLLRGCGWAVFGVEGVMRAEAAWTEDKVKQRRGGGLWVASGLGL